MLDSMTISQCKIKIRNLGFTLKVDNEWQVLKLKGKNALGPFETEIDWPDDKQGKQDAIAEILAMAETLYNQ